MFTVGFAALVGLVFTVGSYVSAGVNTVNLAYDQSIVADSLTQMKDTAAQLKEKALAEPDPDLRQQKLLVAQKLSESQTQLSGYQNKILVNGARKEALALGKSIVAGSLNDAIGLVDSVSDQIVAVKGTHNSKVSDVTIWSKLAKSSESLDVEIAKIKTRQTLKELTGVNDELAQMVKSYQDQEKLGQLDSDKFEEKIGELIETKSELNDYVLAGLDIDTDFTDKQENTNSTEEVINQEETTNQIETQPGKTIYGEWIILETKAEGRNLNKNQTDNVYRFTEDGKYQFIDTTPITRTHHYLYRFENNVGVVTQITKVTSSFSEDMNKAWLNSLQVNFKEFNFEYLPEKDQVIWPKTGLILTRKISQ